MLQTRRDYKALRLGTFERLYVHEATRTYAFARYLDDNLVVAAFNAGNTAATLSIPLDSHDLGGWKDALNLNHDAYFDGQSLEAKLAPRSAAWYIRTHVGSPDG